MRVLQRTTLAAFLLAMVIPSAAQTELGNTIGPPLSPEAAAKLPSRPPLAMPSHIPTLSDQQQSRMDRDLLEVDIAGLQKLYAVHRYTVTEVTRWYLTRIARYNGIYRAFQTVDVTGALATAAREDAQGTKKHGALWGVPIAIKANTAVKGLPDTDGWQGFAQPGHIFFAPKDASVVARLRAAGAVILGLTNMPDFAASDTSRSSAFGRTGNAYDVRFSPGGSSGGTATAVTSNMALLGTGTDTANSIRMPAGTSSLVGLMPTRGMVSIAGIAPLDWLRDNTGPITRSVADAARALDVMAGEDPLDFRTRDEPARTQTPYTRALRKDALKGKRFGVPWFIFTVTQNVLRPETRDMLAQAIIAMRSAGAEVVIDPNLLPESFLDHLRSITTRPYIKDGADQWLAEFGPAQYHTGSEFTQATGVEWPPLFTGQRRSGSTSPPSTVQLKLADDPEADQRFFAPQRAGLHEYEEALRTFHLDGLIYPSAQMPPVDETMPQDGTVTDGPHSETGWVNRIGVPAIVVPCGFYPSGLPFGLEISGDTWKDADLLGWAYAFEQSTRLRRPPVLVERGLLPEKE
jgi:aspartyl-tRNA(Asn)/glutamyl-tRNA(Gln) amidotransferase subunit A